MIPLRLEEIRQAMRARCGSRLHDCVIRGVSSDSRRIQRGDLFFALRGANFDGHDFVAEALRAGAAAAVVQRKIDLPAGLLADASLLMVADTIEALGLLARYVRSRLTCQTVAVTGSNGKTTTKELIAHVLSHRGPVACGPGSYNNAIGVPLTILAAGVDDEYLVCEVGTNRPGEVFSLGRIVQPDVAVITSVAEAHLEGLGDLQGVAREKASLVSTLRPNGLAVINADDPLLRQYVEPFGRRVVTFGCAGEVDLRASCIKTSAEGTQFLLNGRTELTVPLLGRHNVFNVLAAIGACRRLGLELEQICEALRSFRPPPMRLQLQKIGTLTVLNDAYNANPSSMLEALHVLRSMSCAGRRVMVAGDMLELGGQAEQFHEQLGQRIGAAGVDVLLAVGRFAATVAHGAASAGVDVRNVFVFDEARDAADAVERIVGESDLVLLKGSRAVGLEVVVEALQRVFAGT